MKILEEKEKFICAKNLEEARIIQKIVASYLTTSRKKIKSLDEINLIAGIDVGYKGDTGKIAIVIYNFKRKTKDRIFVFREKVCFPYITGFFAFREGRIIVNAVKKIDVIPDVIIFDGHGRIHPLGTGLASHTGFVLGIPSIGCSRNLFYGKYGKLQNKKFSQTYVKDERNKILGIALRSKENTKPIFISEGYGIKLKFCVELIKRFISEYRMPDILREAHILSRR